MIQAHSSPMQDKLRIGIIGIGGWAMFSHVPNLRKTGRVELVAICRRNADALIEAAYLSAREGRIVHVELPESTRNG